MRAQTTGHEQADDTQDASRHLGAAKPFHPGHQAAEQNA